MSSPNSVNKPSDYLDAMKKTIRDLLNADSDLFDVYDYGEFGRKEIKRPAVVLEYYEAPGTNRESDGRIYENLEVWIHCVFPSSVDYAERKAADLSFEIRSSIVSDQGSTKDGQQRYPRWNWGLAIDSVRRPSNIVRQASMFKNGDKGYEAWAVTFIQRVIYEEVDDEEEVRDGISYSCNDNIDDPDSYQELNDVNA